ncbi:MAG TPA: DUF1835 domain-containing protein [Longimicrobium sp.]|nr:DUF1835 domain-containing protein [Longimicrobium sp.]
MLHVTNGESAVQRIRAAGMEGDVLPWQDVLHDGPVPAGLPLEALSRVRAEFIATRGWGEAEAVRRDFAARDRRLAACAADDEVVLWFEHDLYDQLQLVQLLDWFAEHPHPRLTLVNPAEYLGMMDAERMRSLVAARAAVTGAQLALGRAAWDALREPDPRRMEAVAQGDASALPHLGAALRRLLEEYPSVDDGLSRSGRQALRAFAGGPCVLRDAYPDAHHAVEEPIWLGDMGFAAIVDTLASGPAPLLEVEGDPGAPMDRRARITDAGRRVLDGAADALAINGIDRWIGGVHLIGHAVPWRWNPHAGRIVAG